MSAFHSRYIWHSTQGVSFRNTKPQEGDQQSSGVQIKLPLDSARVRYVAVLAPAPHYVRCRRLRVVSTLCSGGLARMC